MVFSVDHYGASSAVLAAPHALETNQFLHPSSNAQKAAAAVDMEEEASPLLVSPRISSAARKRREGLGKKNCSSQSSHKHLHNAAANEATTSIETRILSTTSSSSARRSARQSNVSAPRSGRGLHSVDSFDPADLSEVSSLTDSAPKSSVSVSYADALMRGVYGEEDRVQVGEEEVYQYCEDEVESLCRQPQEEDDEDAGQDRYHLQNADASSYDDEYDIPEELVGCAQPEHDSARLDNIKASTMAFSPMKSSNDDDDGNHMDRHHEVALHRLIDEEDDEEEEHVYDDYDENDDTCLALSSVCSSPRREHYTLEQNGDASRGDGALDGEDYDPMSEVRRLLEITARSAKEEGTLPVHPFLAMESQFAVLHHDRNDMHQQFCSRHYQSQQVSVLDRTTMIRALLFEAHRHQSTRRRVSGDATTDAESLEAIFSDDSRHKRGWRAVAADVDRTMTMEGPMSAQRKLSCMCIFNPHRTDPPMLEGVDDERLRRMARQEALLQNIYERTDNILFADEVREGVSTPHPFSKHLIQSVSNRIEDEQCDDSLHQSHHAEYDDESDDQEIDKGPRLLYEEPISIPLPSYSSSIAVR